MGYLVHALEVLKKNNFKVTHHRECILSIMEKSDVPLSPYQIKKKIGPDIDVVTVYRILDKFVQLNIVHKIFSVGGYIKCSQNKFENCHHFLVCTKCNRVEELIHNNCSHSLHLENSKFKVCEYIYEVTGICGICQNS